MVLRLHMQLRMHAGLMLCAVHCATIPAGDWAELEVDTRASDGSPPTNTYIWWVWGLALKTCACQLHAAAGAKARWWFSCPPLCYYMPSLSGAARLQGLTRTLFALLLTLLLASPFRRRLSHLASYQGMGTALVQCVSGCKCEQSILDGTWGRDASLFTVMRFHVSGIWLAANGCLVLNAGHALLGEPAACCSLMPNLACLSMHRCLCCELQTGRRRQAAGSNFAAAHANGCQLQHVVEPPACHARSHPADPLVTLHALPQVTRSPACRIRVTVLSQPGKKKQQGHKVRWGSWSSSMRLAGLR